MARPRAVSIKRMIGGMEPFCVARRGTFTGFSVLGRIRPASGFKVLLPPKGVASIDPQPNRHSAIGQIGRKALAGRVLL